MKNKLKKISAAIVIVGALYVIIACTKNYNSYYTQGGSIYNSDKPQD